MGARERPKVALEWKCWQDPALHVRYERETQPCYGCQHISTLLGKKYCTNGFTMAKKCNLWKSEK